MAKEERTLLFLKSTGAMIGEITHDTDVSVLDLTQFNTRVILIDEDTEFWQGDYASGKITSKLDRPIVSEAVLKYNTNVQILSEYPIHSQLSIIVDMLAATDLPKTSEFVALHAFLAEVRAEYKEKVRIYSSTPDTYIWRSVADDNIDYAKKII